MDKVRPMLSLKFNGHPEALVLNVHCQITVCWILQAFFEHINERWLGELMNAAQDLTSCLPAEAHPPVYSAAENIQARWKVGGSTAVNGASILSNTSI